MRFFKIFLAILVSVSYPVAAETLKFEAVWHSGSGSNIVTGPLARAAFIKKGEELVQQGLRLIDVETEMVNGQRQYSGLWIGGSGSNLFEGPIGPIPFGQSIKEKRKQGLRLVDFEIITTAGGGRQYLGVWRPGEGEEVLTGRMEQAAFLSRGEKLTKDGLRLKDVEVEFINGVLLYSGLFQSGSGSNFITTPLERPQFMQKRDEFVAKNIELIDVERIRLPGPDKFVGVWSSGPGESRVSMPRTFEKFVAFGVEQTNNGKRTHDMEMMVVAPREPNDDTPNPNEPNDGHPELPDNPPGIDLVDGNILTIDFRLVDDVLQIELPVDNLPTWLPRHNGDVLLPDTFCGLNLRRADSIFWQVPGDDAVDDFPFVATPSVSDLGSDFFLGGVEFNGPIGDCANSDKAWDFPEPFLVANPPPFEPLENMRLVVQLENGGGEIRFRADGQADGATLRAHELYKPQTYNGLLELLENYNPAGPNTPYCDGVDDYFKQVCDETPGECPVNNGTPPSC